MKLKNLIPAIVFPVALCTFAEPYTVKDFKASRPLSLPLPQMPDSALGRKKFIRQVGTSLGKRSRSQVATSELDRHGGRHGRISPPCKCKRRACPSFAFIPDKSLPFCKRESVNIIHLHGRCASERRVCSEKRQPLIQQPLLRMHP